MNGAKLIAAERQRQIDKEGWSEKHDDGHSDGELALAAVCYAAPRRVFLLSGAHHYVDPWPWESQWDKRPRTKNRYRLKDADQMSVRQRVKMLAKAGALIAAEIDRLQRAAQSDDKRKSRQHA